MDSKGVLVAEALTNAGSMDDLKNWAGAQYDYLLFRTNPMSQIVSDFGNDFIGYPTVTVIDLETMKVLKQNCKGYDWNTCVGEFL